MKMNEIRKIAKKMGINSFGFSKIALVRKIQEKEGNFQCFATNRATDCPEISCLWKDDCAKLFAKES